MFQANPKAGLPSAGDIARLELDAIIAANPITEDRVAPLFMPESVRENLSHAWDTFRGPVKRLTDFRVSYDLHQSRHGYVTVFARYHDGGVHPGVELAIEPDDEEEREDDVLVLEADTLRDEYAKEEFWAEVWKSFEPVEQLKAEAGPRPNDPCACGSGRKFKKCHGRFA